MRSKDRLPDLLQRAAAANGVYGDTVLPVEDTPRHDDKHQDLHDMLSEAEAAVAACAALDARTQQLRALLAHPAYHASHELQSQLDNIVSGGAGAARDAATALRRLEDRAARAESSGGAIARAVRLQTACARARHRAALERQHEALDALRNERLQLLRSQIALTNASISEEECESLLDNNNLKLFVDNIAAETAAARLALRDAEARRADLLRVEAALQDVHALFTQLATLVAQQQEQIDSVEYFALQATEHVEVGGQELLKGNVFRKKTKQKKIGLIICLATGILIVLFVLIYT